jgi:hypothetical protein
MADTLSVLVEKRHPQSLDEYDQALREVLQEFMLLALWRGKFFHEAAFYGGTALRLFYGLDRFSEDLDFSLLRPNPDFRFDPWFEFIKKELRAQGLEVITESKEKTSPVQSAFLKTNTKQALITIRVSDTMASRIPSNRLMKVKFEADTDPPSGFLTENKLLLEPIPFSVKILTPECLFAGKFHALLARGWAHRVKGRDWYDLTFFVRRDIPVHLAYLSSRLKANPPESKALSYSPDKALTEAYARELLEQKIRALDVAAARDEVYPFVYDRDQLRLWSREFFLEIARRVRFC